MWLYQNSQPPAPLATILFDIKCLTGFWLCLGFWFWIYQGFEYAGVTWNSDYASVCQNNFWASLNMPKYAWMRLNLPKWLLFHFPIIIPCLLEHMVTYSNIYILTRSYSLRDYGTLPLERFFFTVQRFYVNSMPALLHIFKLNLSKKAISMHQKETKNYDIVTMIELYCP